MPVIHLPHTQSDAVCTVTKNPPVLYTHDMGSQTLTAFALLDLGKPGWRDFNIAALGREYDGKVLIHDSTNNDFYLVDLTSGFAPATKNILMIISCAS